MFVFVCVCVSISSMYYDAIIILFTVYNLLRLTHCSNYIDTVYRQALRLIHPLFILAHDVLQTYISILVHNHNIIIIKILDPIYCTIIDNIIKCITRTLHIYRLLLYEQTGTIYTNQNYMALDSVQWISISIVK